MIAVSGVVFSCGIDTEAAVVRRLEKLRGVEPEKGKGGGVGEGGVGGGGGGGGRGRKGEGVEGGG